MGASPVSGWKIFPPNGMAITGAPPVAGRMSCGPKFGCGANEASGSAEGGGEAVGKLLASAEGRTVPWLAQPAVTRSERPTINARFITLRQ